MHQKKCSKLLKNVWFKHVAESKWNIKPNFRPKFFPIDFPHSGSEKGTYVNDSEVLERLVEVEIKVDVRATPYQVRDQWRPWIREEMEGFLDKIKKLGAKGTNYDLIPRFPLDLVSEEKKEEILVAEGAARDINAHFAIIDHFCRVSAPRKVTNK